MKRNRLILSDDNDDVILEEFGEHGDNYFCFIDRDVDYAYTFHKSKIDEIIKFLESIK